MSEKILADPFLKTVHEMLSRALNQVGVLTVLAAVAAFGLAKIFLDTSAAVGAACFTLGVVGLLEAFHIKQQAHLIERCQSGGINAVFNDMSNRCPNWNPKIFKQFSHGGFKFNAIGVEEFPVPLTVSKPICSTCGSYDLLELAECRFPGRVRIEIRCACGRVTPSKKSVAELMQEATQLAGVPQ